MRNRYKYQWSERRIKFAEDGSGDYEESDDYDPEAYHSTDLQGVLNEIQNGCWDHVDLRDDCIICYPADSRMDYKTGEYIDDTLFIRGAEKDLERLFNCYDTTNV